MSTIAFFGHDANESTVIKRAAAFKANGARVIGFMFRRLRRGSAPEPAWENVDLGITRDLNYLRRLPKLMAAVAKCVSRRDLLRQCDIMYARNIDMLLLAHVAKRLTGSDAIVVYEALDVRRVFIAKGRLSDAFRWLERRLLTASDMLVVSSTDFVTQYFEPIQGYRGPWRLLENKVALSQIPADGLEMKRTAADGPPWVIGIFGVLRCWRSLEILEKAAAALPDKVVVHIRGRPSDEDLPLSALEEFASRQPNIHYLGPYRSPQDLADIYGQLHFTWAADYQDAGINSDWCLTNRLYEGSLYGSVALAGQGTATARMIEREGLGFTLSEPLETTLPAFLAGLDSAAYAEVRAKVAAAPRTLFVDETDTRELLQTLEQLAAARKKRGRTLPAENPQARSST
jgi:succinoglycan biosynthesis protein ExoL